MKFTAYIEFDKEAEIFTAVVPGIRGAHTQAKDLTELEQNLKEVLELLRDETPEQFEELDEFVGIHQVEVA